MGLARIHPTLGVLLLLLASVLAWPAAAEEKPGDMPAKAADKGLFDSLSLTSRREPIHIRSRDLEFRYDEKRITYRGEVLVQQGDVTLKSDLLTVTYEEPTATKGGTAPTASATATAGATMRQQLKEIIAEGNVEIVSGDRRATGKKAVFDETKRTVVLSGDAALQEGGNRVSGERVTVFLDEKRSVVEGGKERAQMVFLPQQQDDGKRKKTP